MQRSRNAARREIDASESSSLAIDERWLRNGSLHGPADCRFVDDASAASARKENHHILFLDTEGLDSPHVAPFYNWSLAALALLISDVFIYQSKGSIDQNAIDQLDVILRVAEQLRGDWSPSTEAQDGKRKDTGNMFLWLLRDHHLTMRSAPKEEMLEKLDSSATRTLRRCFEEYDCFPLPAPLSDAADLRRWIKRA